MPLTARPLGFVPPPIIAPAAAVAVAVGLGFLTVLGLLDLATSCVAAALLAVAPAMVMPGNLLGLAVTPAMVMSRFAARLVVASAMVMACFAAAVRPFTAAFSIAARVCAVTVTLTRTVLALGSTFPVAIAVGLTLVARSTVPLVSFPPFVRRRTDPVETRQSHH